MKNALRVLTPCLLAAVLTACATARPPPTYRADAAFDADMARRLVAPGPNKITGNAFMRQRGGGVVTCAGDSVYLVPATSYARERIQFLYGAANYRSIRMADVFFENEPPEYRSLTRVTQCDAQGRFTFADVADGTFFVTARVRWEVAGSREGGYMARAVELGGGKTVDLVIAD